MAFRFRLEKVARHRQRLVDEQGRRVAEANRAVNQLRARLAALESDLAGQLDELADGRPSAVSVQGLVARTMWVDHLDRLRAAAAVELGTALNALAAQQEQLNAFWRDLEVLNKLREKQKTEWQQEQARREKIELDEVGQIRADRQRRSNAAT